MDPRMQEGGFLKYITVREEWPWPKVLSRSRSKHWVETAGRFRSSSWLSFYCSTYLTSFADASTFSTVLRIVSYIFGKHVVFKLLSFNFDVSFTFLLLTFHLLLDMGCLTWCKSFNKHRKSINSSLFWIEKKGNYFLCRSPRNETQNFLL